MPPTPTKPRKSKAFFEQDKYTAELTSGQLVIGVTILLVFGLVCFMLGVIVGKFQPTSAQMAAQPPLQQAIPPQQLPPPEVEVQTPVTTPKREPERLSTGPVAVSPDRTVTPSLPPATDEPPTLNEPRIVAFPEPDETATAAPPAVEDADTLELPPAPTDTEPEPAAEDEPAPTLDEPVRVAEAEPAELTPVQTSPAQTASPPAVQPPVLEPEEPAVETPPPAAGTLTVQVAALSNRARAEGVQRQIQSSTDYEVRLTPSPNGTLVMVQVGRYADRASAGRVRAEMRERFGFDDSFITTIR